MKRKRRQVIGFTLKQVRHHRRWWMWWEKGEQKMINGTALGATSTFQIGLVPGTNFVPLQSGPSVAVDDANVTLTQPDASLQFTATVAATDTAASYNLTITGVNGAGTTITHKFNIPILPAPPQQVSDFSLDQLS